MNTPAVKIARRSTADGKHVHLWSDGSLTWALGYTIKGSAHPRTDAQREEALRAGWLVLGDVELYDADELPALIRAARATAKRGGTPADMRVRLHRDPAPRLNWTILSTDRDGKPTVRCASFPRLSPMRDLVIWHERGRYEVMSRHSTAHDTLFPTGSVAGTATEAIRLAKQCAGLS